jgi:hypothetical protein
MSRLAPAGGWTALTTGRNRLADPGGADLGVTNAAEAGWADPGGANAGAADPAARPPADPSAAPAVPASWPSAWPSLRPRLLRRAAFVAAVELLTVVGLVAVADPVAQWWAVLPPLLLLAGPATAPARARRRAQRATAAGRLVIDPDGLVRPAAAGRRPLAQLAPDGTLRYLR